VRDGDIDEILNQAAQVQDKLEPALLKRIGDSIQPSMRAVRTLPSTWALTSGLLLVGATIAVLGAARAGFFGFTKMNLLERVGTLSTLSILIWLSGAAFVKEMIPGSRRRLSPAMLAGICTLFLGGVFALLFRDSGTAHFFSAGMICLLTGLLHAVPVALLGWLVLRRGFAVNPVSAGLAAGTLAGLAGVTVLELHCPNFQAAHVLVWHTAVVPLGAAAGALAAWTFSSRSANPHKL
jgi:hypothetical protein